jgi:hypothetical protein
MVTMRTRNRLTSVVVAMAMGAPLAGAAALPASGVEPTAAGVQGAAAEQVVAGDLDLAPTADPGPHTRMKAVMTGPMQMSFAVRPKLPSGENWKVVLKVKECGRQKEWIVVQRARTKGRREVFTLDGMRVIRKLMKDDGKNSGVRAYRLITPAQRGYERTVKTFRDYPLDNAPGIRIGTC